MVSIARKNLFYDLPRFIVAQAGIMFAVGLVTIQTGILNGFTKSTSILLEQSNADIWIAHEKMRHLDLTLPIPYNWVETAAAVEGVERAEGLISKGSIWRHGDDELSLIRIIGVDLEGELLTLTPLDSGNLTALSDPYAITVDVQDQTTLDIAGLGSTAEIGSYEAKVVGLTSGIRSIVTSPFVFTSLANANSFTTSPIASPEEDPSQPQALSANSEISYIMIKAADGESLDELKTRLAQEFPDSRIMTQTELTQITQNYWRNSTGVGYILGLGAIVGVVVGTVVVGQILYSSVSDHIREYGTLKAMGSPDRFLYQVILEQAFWMALLGYIPGIALSLGVGSLALNAQAIQILVSPVTAGIVLVVTIVMCSGAAIFAIQKVTRLDPAMVFKS